MPTKNTHSRTELNARRAAGEGHPGLGDELVDEALARARLRERGLPVERLPVEVREQMTDGIIDELLAGARTEAEIVGPGGLLSDLTCRLVERAMSAELTEHLGHEPHAEPPGGTGNTRNGTTAKTLQTRQGAVRVEAPRDRQGSFEPKIVKKGQRRFEGWWGIHLSGLEWRDRQSPSRKALSTLLGRVLGLVSDRRRLLGLPRVAALAGWVCLPGLRARRWLEDGRRPPEVRGLRGAHFAHGGHDPRTARARR